MRILIFASALLTFGFMEFSWGAECRSHTSSVFTSGGLGASGREVNSTIEASSFCFNIHNDFKSGDLDEADRRATTIARIRNVAASMDGAYVPRNGVNQLDFAVTELGDQAMFCQNCPVDARDAGKVRIVVKSNPPPSEEELKKFLAEASLELFDEEATLKKAVNKLGSLFTGKKKIPVQLDSDIADLDTMRDALVKKQVIRADANVVNGESADRSVIEVR